MTRMTFRVSTDCRPAGSHGGRRAARLLMLLFLFGAAVAPVSARQQTVRLYLFWQEGCPMCERMKPFVRELAARHPELEVVEIEVERTIASIRALQDVAAKFGISSPNVPAVFLGARAWIGFNESVTAELQAHVPRCIAEGCIDALEDPLPESAPSGAVERLDTRLFGRISLGSLPLVLATALIAGVDGLNPCSLWVLTFLLGMVIHTGSRKKILLVGLVFLAVTSLIYGMFIAGVTQLVRLLAYVTWIRYAIAALAFAMGAVNVKDFFAFKKGVSLTISDEQKRRFGVRSRALLSGDRSTPSLVVTTVLLAAGVAVVELPCTAGFPVIWSNLLSHAQVVTAVFFALLGLYLLIYLIEEIAIITAAVITFKRIGMDEKRGRFLKLLGGSIMVALGVVMLVKPELMESFAAVAVVFAGSIAVAVLVALIDRRISARADPRGCR